MVPYIHMYVSACMHDKFLYVGTIQLTEIGSESGQIEILSTRRFLRQC